jgi:hypothetical protein
MKTKWLVVGIILLFIGVAVAPSINSTGHQMIVASDNHPPNDPTITGPQKGKVGVAYLFNFWTTDPENQNVSYFIDWGDNTSTGWSYYYKSGQYVHYSHTFDKWDFYAIRCKAKDTLGAESNWSYISIPMFEDTSDDLIEVTSQACGIQGFGNTMVKLTKQQYQNLEQYLVDFRERLNHTTTREQAVPIFKDAVAELNKYGLLPKGMSVEQAQRLVTMGNHLQNTLKNMEKFNPSVINSYCLFTAIFNSSIDLNVFTLFGYWLASFGGYGNLLAIIFGIIFVYFGMFKPLRFMNQITDIGSVILFFSIGLGGIKRGQLDISTVKGFTGLKIALSSKKVVAFYLGFALDIS